MLEVFTNSENLMALLALTSLEIVLGLDNIVFIAILTDRLEESKRALAYRLGLTGALVTRLLLLLGIKSLMELTKPLLYGFSGKDLILLFGGLFLVAKSTHEIYENVELAEEEAARVAGPRRALLGVVFQIMIMDVIFSLDSVITAVGIVDRIEIMVVAIVIAMIVMLIFAKRVGDFVNRHPSMKILALSFLLLIGALLVTEGLGHHVSKGAIYFAMAFSFLVEVLNMRWRRNTGGAGSARLAGEQG